MALDSRSTYFRINRKRWIFALKVIFNLKHRKFFSDVSVKHKIQGGLIKNKMEQWIFA